MLICFFSTLFTSSQNQNNEAIPAISWETTMPSTHPLSIPMVNTEFKSYMDYRAINNTNSKQWELQQIAYTDENGLRKIDDYYCVAVGTFYAKQCGKKFIVRLASGKVLKVIASDIKNNNHTDVLNMYAPMTSKTGNVLEFLVDTRKLPQIAKIMGDISVLGYNGNIVDIREIVEQ